MTGPAYERFAGRLRELGKKVNGGNAQCPAHEDKDASLSIRQKDFGDAGIIVKCHGGCSLDDVLLAMGFSRGDLFDVVLSKKSDREWTAEYVYKDEQRQPLLRVSRYREPGNEKGYLQQRADMTSENGWKTGLLQETRRVLYRLPELLDAVASKTTVWITEGEKDVHSLVDRGHVATTNPGGAGKWNDSYSSVFVDADVCIVRDNDSVGHAHALRVAKAIALVATRVRVFDVIPQHKGADVSDHFAAGYDIADLTPVADTGGTEMVAGVETHGEWGDMTWTEYLQGESVEVPESVPSDWAEVPEDDKPPRSERTGLRKRLFTTQELQERPPQSWLINGVIPDASIGMIWGQPGVKKSFLAIDWALSVATGNWWNGREVRRCPVVYVAAEGDAGLSKRHAAWSEVNRTWKLGDAHWLADRVDLQDNTEVTELTEIISEVQAGLVIIDTLNRSLPGADENSSTAMSTAIEAADLIRKKTGASVMFIHHSTKSGDTARGHGALKGGVEFEIEMRQNGTIITVLNEKQKDADIFSPIRLRTQKARDSIVLVPASHTSTEADDAALTNNMQSALQVLSDRYLPDGLPTGKWEKAFVETTGLSEPTFHRAKSKLVERDSVKNEGTKSRPLWTPSRPNGVNSTVTLLRAATSN